MRYMDRKFLVLICLIMVVAFITGCAGGYGRAGKLNSFLAGGCPASAVSMVADDLASRLAESYPPGHTRIHLKQTGSHSDALGTAFEQALRSRGFAISAESGPKVLTVAYVMDRIDEATWYSRLSVSTGLIISRTYVQKGETLEMMAATKTGQPGGENGPR